MHPTTHHKRRAGLLVGLVAVITMAFTGVIPVPTANAAPERVIPPTDVLGSQSIGSTAGTLPTNVITKVSTWGGPNPNIGSAWDSPNNRWEIPTGATGTYQVTSSVDWNSPCANATGLIQVRVNNAAIYNIGQEELSGDPAGNRPIFGATMIVNLNAGDYVDLRLRHTCPTPMGATVRTFAIDRIA